MDGRVVSYNHVIQSRPPGQSNVACGDGGRDVHYYRRESSGLFERSRCRRYRGPEKEGVTTSRWSPRRILEGRGREDDMRLTTVLLAAGVVSGAAGLPAAGAATAAFSLAAAPAAG